MKRRDLAVVAAVAITSAACGPTPVPPSAGPTRRPAPSYDDLLSGYTDPRCSDRPGRDGLVVIANAVAACVGDRYTEDLAVVAEIARALGTRTGEASEVMCAMEIPTIYLIDASGESVELWFCGATGFQEARFDGGTILTARPDAVEAWMRARQAAPNRSEIAVE